MTHLLHRLERLLRAALPDPTWTYLQPDEPACAGDEVGAPPGLALLTDRVLYATRGIVEISEEDAAHVIHEALWQIAHLVRMAEVVEIPEIGTLSRVPNRYGYVVNFTPSADLLEALDA